MSLEQGMGQNPPKEEPKVRAVDETRRSVVEEVFRKYDKNLRTWCSFKMKRMGVDDNRKRDIEDIVGNVYIELLTDTTPIDLSRSDGEIREYLNLKLDQGIIRLNKKQRALKRIPQEELVSLEELLAGGDEEALSPKIKERLMVPISDNEEIYEKTEEAIRRISEKNPRMADVFRRIMKGESQKHIAEIYGISGNRISVISLQAKNIVRKFVLGFPNVRIPVSEKKVVVDTK